MRRSRIFAFNLAFLSLVTAIFSASPAFAGIVQKEPESTRQPVHEVATNYDGVYVMDGYASGAIQNSGATFYPLPAEAEGALIGSGYYTGYNGGSFGLWKSWYGTGCGTSGAARVPWDNVLAYPSFMARSMVVYAGVPGQFR